MRKILESAWSAYLMILKRVGDNIFFQSNKFTACKVKDEKQVANSLMAFSPLKIIHPLQGKKHLRTFRFKYKLFSIITQLNVTVTVVLYLKAYYMHILLK